MSGPEKKAADLFDSYAGEYSDKFNRNPLGRYQRQKVHELLNNYIHPGNVVLDAGCGPGSDFPFWQSAGVHLSALDISPQMCALAVKESEKLKMNVSIHCSSVTGFIPEQKYDLILLNFGVLNAIADWRVVLEKLSGWLNPGGRIVAVVMPRLHLFTLIHDLLRGKWRRQWQRVFRGKTSTSDGGAVYYGQEKIFSQLARVEFIRPMAVVLPNPDQYAGSAAARKLCRMLMPVERIMAKWSRGFLGGDHVCYVLHYD
jgi:ubiquinone/menaquinone biosynthesis C-methylase UbiE